MTQFMESMRDTAHKIGIFCCIFVLHENKEMSLKSLEKENINLCHVDVCIFKSKSLSYVYLFYLQS